VVAKLVWRVKLVAELRPGEVTETEVARIERDEQGGMADLGLRLTETKQLMAALQGQIVPAQVTVVGERRCSWTQPSYGAAGTESGIRRCGSAMSKQRLVAGRYSAPSRKPMQLSKR
jgi:hypothetical protein